jgi:hypothetical protein
LSPMITRKSLFDAPVGTVYENDCEVVFIAACTVRGVVSKMVGEVVAVMADVLVPSNVSSPSLEDVKYGMEPYRFCDPVLLSRWI